MTVSYTGLELRLHVAGLVSLGPHETALVVLNTHDSLGSIPALGPVLGEESLVLEVWLGDVDWCRRGGYEA